MRGAEISDLDNRALQGVKINIIMGRHAGFLTAAAALKTWGAGFRITTELYGPDVPVYVRVSWPRGTGIYYVFLFCHSRAHQHFIFTTLPP